MIDYYKTFHILKKVSVSPFRWELIKDICFHCVVRIMWKGCKEEADAKRGAAL